MTTSQKVWTGVSVWLLVFFIGAVTVHGVFSVVFFLSLFGVILYLARKHRIRKEAVRATVRAGNDRMLVCPHCQTRGNVSTMDGRTKQGISGGKATGALLTLGLSILVTGLSRKQGTTFARCSTCDSRWAWQR